VVVFGLANTPSDFMSSMKKPLWKHIEIRYSILFLENIMIDSKNEGSHENHVHRLRDTIHRDIFRMWSKKCQFVWAAALFRGLKLNGSHTSITSRIVAPVAD
ncbi:hypothetical protein K440DRAFT_573495, partial [Wilcoxina mikolae CBS 423.85]